MEADGTMEESSTHEFKRKAENGKDSQNETNENCDSCEPNVKCAKYEIAASTDLDEKSKTDQYESDKVETSTSSPSVGEKNALESHGTTEKNDTNLDKIPDVNLDKNPDITLDPLAYTKVEEFTSEIFKIQIHNLPKFGYSDLKKRLTSLGLKPHKLKSPRQQVTYVCFRNESDRQEALKKLNGHVWRGRTLEAKEAAPIADPFLQKKQQQRNQNKLSSASDSVVSSKEEPLTFEEAQKRLKDSVVPLWNMDYPKQLENKTEKMKSVLKKMTHHQFVREQFRQMESWKQDGMPCPMLPIIPSPVKSEYRTKNEFTIGYSQDGKTIIVGFRYGLYKDGTTSVGNCTNLGVVKATAVPIIESFEKFVSQSKWAPYLQQTGTGHWHTLTLRTFDTGDVMAMVDFHPRKLNKVEIEEARDSVKDFYSNGEGKDIDIKSFYFRLYAKGPEAVPRLENICGEAYVYESLLGLRFRISPEAFFQVNTKATERLYSLIGEWCESSQSSTILDICCGTGTIGLSMAKNVKQVIGVEMCKPAVDDATANATINDITNVKYYCSKVEDVIGKVLASVDTSSPSSPSPVSDSAGSTELSTRKNVIAVVDPPRAGLHKSVIKMLRKTEDIERLVYISCNPENAMENFIDLLRPSSGKLKGPPFSLVKAIPVDLFPGTRHCELVLLFTRQLS